jgi:putative transposase
MSGVCSRPSPHTKQPQALPNRRSRPLHHFSCYRRLPFLNHDHARTVFLDILEHTRRRHQFYVFGYVLMPEHVHLLLSEPKHHKLENTIRTLKTETSRRLKGKRPQFWQTRYYDFNVLTQTKFVEKLRYIHRNPVARGLVDDPEDWPWSSYRHWLTGETEQVEIESHWTHSHRERSGSSQSNAPDPTSR